MAKKEAKSNKENSKNKKSFFKGFKAELKKVIWLTPKQLVNNTVAVIIIVFITAAIVFVLDLTFEAMNKHGIEKLKESIGTNTSITQDVNDEQVQEETTQEESQDTQSDETSQTQQETENVEDNTQNQ